MFFTTTGMRISSTKENDKPLRRMVETSVRTLDAINRNAREWSMTSYEVTGSEWFVESWLC